MAYREKSCPTCGTLHRKKGTYCSRSCGNSRVHSEEHKQYLSKKATERLANDEDARLEQKDNARKGQLAAKGIITDPVPPQIENRFLDDHREVIDGDYWIEDGY